MAAQPLSPSPFSPSPPPSSPPQQINAGLLPVPGRAESPHLVSLVLASKKALAHGEQLCLRAEELSRSTKTLAVDVMALDARVRWVINGVGEQVKLAAGMAKLIDIQRKAVEEKTERWDQSRADYTSKLDNVLEALGSQSVPPDFHEAPESPSIFGAPSDDETEDDAVHPYHHRSGTRLSSSSGSVIGLNGKTSGSGSIKINGNTKVNGSGSRGGRSRKRDRSKWKTLRDFVHEAGIEEAVEAMENDRQALDDLVLTTASFPAQLQQQITSIQSLLPPLTDLPNIDATLRAQEKVSAHMAQHLESLAEHYGQMTNALKEREAGGEFNADDMADMNRDTDELPVIIAELDADVQTIEASHRRLLNLKDSYNVMVNRQRDIVDRLDDLGELMAIMLERQEAVKTEAEAYLETLHSHLTTFTTLHATYTAYRHAYDSLLVELERRRRFRDGTRDLIKDMAMQLDILREEEMQRRQSFNAEHREQLPDDLYIGIANLPTKWTIVPPADGEGDEIPEFDQDLLLDARKNLEPR